MARNVEGTKSCRATTAHALAYDRASRPKAAKLATNLVLRAKVEKDLEKEHSSEQIAARLRLDFPEEPEMRVCPETTLLCLSSGRLLSQRGHGLGERAVELPGDVSLEAAAGFA